jgi:addiction module HigA family antidote
MIPKNRPPTPPGEILLEEFLRPMGMTQTALAGRMSVPLQRVNTLINGKRAVTADTALLLSEIFGTSPEFWMNLQAQRDLYAAQRRRDEKRPPHRSDARPRRRPQSRPIRSASTHR